MTDVGAEEEAFELDVTGAIVVPPVPLTMPNKTPIDSTISHLRLTFPEATKEECKRFALSGRNISFEDDNEKLKTDAMETLEAYLKWRKCYQMDDMGGFHNEYGSSDVDDGKLWVYSCGRTQQALDRLNNKKSKKKTRKKAVVTTSRAFKENPKQHSPPQFIFLHRIEDATLVDKEGNSILH
ncbi:MAG: hypothetical protein SGILL_010728, partial [Bacillariaceae sp.]